MEHVINSKKLFLFFLLIASMCASMIIDNAYAHISQDNNTSAVQEWKDQRNNVKIQFSYSPDKPLVYASTDLKFSIQDLNTGNHVKDLDTSLTIIKDDKIFFKFNDIAIHDGDLSLKVQFLEAGNYQAISQVRSADNTAVALTSFNILVPLQPLGKFNADSLSSYLFPAGLVAISLSVLVIALIIVSRRKEKIKKPMNGEMQKERKEEDD
jgi:hypothetical protein